MVGQSKRQHLTPGLAFQRTVWLRQNRVSGGRGAGGREAAEGGGGEGAAGGGGQGGGAMGCSSGEIGARQRGAEQRLHAIILRGGCKIAGSSDALPQGQSISALTVIQHGPANKKH